MKILWIAYGVLGKANELFYGKKSQGGGWIEESANHLFPLLKESSLTIVSLGKENREIIDKETVTNNVGGNADGLLKNGWAISFRHR